VEDKDEIKAGENVSVSITLSKDIDEEDLNDFVYAPYYPKVD
jgi:hypothetical protein